jgi:aromatic ring-opening dioxygenase LigB subunit
MGECVKEAARKSPTKVAFVASADQGHAHLRSGPYGFDSASQEYDSKVLSIVKSGKLGELLRFSPEFIERAKPDSLWQMLMLYGVVKGSGLKPAECSYSCPTYYGMLSAAFV